MCFCLMNDIKSQPEEMRSANVFDFERLVQSKAVRVIDERQLRTPSLVRSISKID